MAAVAYPRAVRQVRMRPPLVSVSGAGHQPVPGSRPGATPNRHQRAALAAVVLAAVVLLAVVLVAALAGPALQGALAVPGGGPLSATGPAGVAREPVAAHIHVVQPGETLWSIVAAGGRHGDPRPAVDRLEAQLGGRPLQVGQRLVLP